MFTTVKRIANSTILVGIAAVVAGLIWLYSGALDKVYNYEQNSKLSEQPEYYYAEFFGSRLLGPTAQKRRKTSEREAIE